MQLSIDARAAEQRVDAATLSYAEVKRRIRRVRSGPGIPPGYWGMHADEQSLGRAARDLLTEEDPRKLRHFLEIFSKRSFPFGPESLISLAKRQDEQVVRAALKALEAIEHPVVRALALELLESPRWRHKGVSLLRKIYQAGDHLRVMRAMQVERNETLYHWIGLSALDVFETNPTPECAPILIRLYETGPCTLCRKRSVDLLDRLGVLPPWMIDECQYDANPRLREKARALSRHDLVR